MFGLGTRSIRYIISGLVTIPAISWARVIPDLASDWSGAGILASDWLLAPSAGGGAW